MNGQSSPSRERAARMAVSRRTGWFVAAAMLAAADLILKTVVEARLRPGQVLEFPVVDISLSYNPGVAFGLGTTLPDWVVAAVTGVIIAALGAYLWHQCRQAGPLYLGGLTAVLGGAAGNFIDRLDDGAVTDYLHTGWFPTFNLADTLITLGVGVFIVATLIESRHSRPAEKNHGAEIGHDGQHSAASAPGRMKADQ